jgi:surfeit locus 1 family protein
LTVTAALALAVLVGLGAWQLQRLAWKTALLARISALQNTPPRPLGPVLADASQGRDVAYARVDTACGPPRGAAPLAFRYAVRDGQVAWRLLTLCPLAAGPYDSILLDRGLVTALGGLMAPQPVSFAPPGDVVGVLRSPGAGSSLDQGVKRGSDGVATVQALDKAAIKSLAASAGGARPAPYFLAVERETPVPPGLVPAALPQDIPNNHLVYALTWFGMAGVLVWIYLALVLKRLRS